MRSDSAPATGATTSGVAVQGRTRTPACSGELCSASWKYCAIRKAAANCDPLMKKAGGVGRGKGQAAEQAHRQHRLLRSQLPDYEAGHQRQAESECANGLRAGPALIPRVNQAQQYANSTARDQRSGGQIEPSRGAEALSEPED